MHGEAGKPPATTAPPKLMEKQVREKIALPCARHIQGQYQGQDGIKCFDVGACHYDSTEAFVINMITAALRAADVQLMEES
jgi:hypothetical protein